MKLQKIVAHPEYSDGRGFLSCTEELRIGGEGGAILLGVIVTVPVCPNNSRLRWVKSWSGPVPREFLAYALVDGNGARRTKRSEAFQDLGDGLLSPYLRPLVCAAHQPRVIQHDLLLMPTPLAWGHRFGVKNVDAQLPHEEWCLDSWFPQQPDACWVIRETADSKPLQESFALMPASEPSDLPVFFVSLFVETEPEQLVKELAALYQVSVQPVLESTETMQRLKTLYGQIHVFPLDQ